jgi:hypothetical protein
MNVRFAYMHLCNKCALHKDGLRLPGFHFVEKKVLQDIAAMLNSSKQNKEAL